MNQILEVRLLDSFESIVIVTLQNTISFDKTVIQYYNYSRFQQRSCASWCPIILFVVIFEALLLLPWADNRPRNRYVVWRRLRSAPFFVLEVWYATESL